MTKIDAKAFNFPTRTNVYFLAGDDWEEGFETETDLINSDLLYEAWTVKRRNFDDTITDVVEEVAEAWWAKFKGQATVPEIFENDLSILASNLADEPYSDPNDEHRTHVRGIGI